MFSAMHTLGQSAAARQSAVDILTALIVIVALGVAAAVIGFVIWRRFTRSEDEPATPTTAFTLADLRTLHRQGQLSDEEFERARSAIIARARAAMDPDASTPAVNDGDGPASGVDDSDKGRRRDPDDDQGEKAS